MKKIEKSLLDGVPVVDEAFPLADKLPKKKSLYGIVGHCPTCGAPIYGHAVTAEEQPECKYSCSCQAQRAHFK